MILDVRARAATRLGAIAGIARPAAGLSGQVLIVDKVSEVQKQRETVK